MILRAAATFVSCALFVGCSSNSVPVEREAAWADAQALAKAAPGTVRSFSFTYATKIAPPADAKTVRVWVPLPSTDETQKISNLKIESPVAHKETQDPLYGNRLAYFESQGATEIPITVSFDVIRREIKEIEDMGDAAVAKRALEPDRLAPIDGEVSKRAQTASAGKSSVSETSRALYDRTLADVAYDKSGQGWGKGDIKYVCEVGKGNCSDFHALFIGMARARGIPSIFEIGFPLPVGKTEGEIGGYHCWAWYKDGGVWKPVDASEADKDPSKTDYYYGTICANRVGLSKGRDVVLEPRQAGEPVNFLIYPYVEVDGKADTAKVERKFSFADSGANKT